MNRAIALLLLFAPWAAVHAQVGAATPPSTPGTSLGSGRPTPGLPGPRDAETQMCERLKGEGRDKCLRARAPGTPGAVGPGSGGMGSGRGGGSSVSGPGTGTAPGTPTR
jgi:hypothetical protein